MDDPRRTSSPRGPRAQATYVGVVVTKAKVLLVMPVGVLDRARVFAGEATALLKIPVSLQIVLRALIEEGLKRTDDPTLLANVERQAHTVRRIRRAARRSTARSRNTEKRTS